jgi:hypothetical protein
VGDSGEPLLVPPVKAASITMVSKIGADMSLERSRPRRGSIACLQLHGRRNDVDQCVCSEHGQG